MIFFSGTLLFGLALNWISYLTHLKVNAFAWTDCKLPAFCWYFFHHYSSALLVMMSVEKCIVVYFPLKTKKNCTVKTAKWLCLIFGIVFAAYNSQFFFIIEGRLTEKNRISCVNTGISDQYISIYHQLDSIIYSFAPFAIMGLTNIAIIYKFTKAKMALKRGTESTNQALSKSATRGTAILITVSLTFIILTGPSAITWAVTTKVTQVQRTVLFLLEASNSAINGVLYCIVGTRFRTELFGLICCGKRSSGKSVTSMGTSVSTVSTN